MKQKTLCQGERSEISIPAHLFKIFYTISSPDQINNPLYSKRRKLTLTKKTLTLIYRRKIIKGKGAQLPLQNWGKILFMQ